MVCDFKIPKLVIADYLEMLDHSMCINKEDPAYEMFVSRYHPRVIVFEGDPTTELMASQIYQLFNERLKEYSGPYKLRPKVRLRKVRVSETSSSWAEYYEDEK
jgi:6-pyruvoyltetrahydropterin/6-carboxytetrahydropterin synthase